MPPIKGISPYTLCLVKELSLKCEIDFYGFKLLYPEFLYPGSTRTEEEEPIIDNVSIKNYLTWYNPLSWIKTGFSIDTEIVHAQWWSWFVAPAYLIILSLLRLRKKRIIMTIHNVKPHEKSLIKNFLNKSATKLANEYIVHSENNRVLFLEVTKTKKKIHVVPHGIIEINKSKFSQKELKKIYGFSDMDRILLFFGNIRDYKGLDVLLKCLNDFEDENIKLIIAGKPWRSFNEYESIMSNPKLKKRIQLFLEYNSSKRVAELFKLSDLAVYPYKEFEASSGAASIALNFEKPMVVTDVGGLPEIVKDKKVIARPNDSDDLKVKITYALNNLKKLERESRQISKEYSWEKGAAKTIRIYDEMRSI